MPIYTIAAGGNSPNTTNSASRSTTSVTAAASTITATGGGFTMHNPSTNTATVFVAYGSTPAVTTTSYSFPLVPGAFYEDPFKFNGTIQLIGSAAGPTEINVTVFS